MASTAITSAGTTIGVSASLPTTHDAAGFGALTFDLIGEITDLGEFGREYNLVTHNPLGDRRTVKRKGSYNDGSVNLQMALDRDDAGQAILITGQDSDNSHSFEVTLQDGAIVYFTAQIMSYKTVVGSVDNIMMANTVLEIDDDIVYVAAP